MTFSKLLLSWSVRPGKAGDEVEFDTVDFVEFDKVVRVELKQCSTAKCRIRLRRQFVRTVGCVAQLVERRSLTCALSLSCARPAADG